MDKVFDLIIIGAGPAGLAASIYASRYGIGHCVVGRILGGQIAETHLIDNYPGMEDVSGFDFSQKWGNHAKKYGVEIIPELVKLIGRKENLFSLELENKSILSSQAVLLATGTRKRKLDIIGEKELLGKGVSYCATCDGFFYKNKTVGVIGGGDSAAGAALHLAGICEKVYLIYRGKELRTEPYWIGQIQKNNVIECIYETNVVEIVGQEKLGMVLLDKEYSGEKELNLDGLFIEAGSDPDISYAKDLGVELDEGGYVKITKNGATSVPGVFAAGDITDGSDKFRQVLTAAAEGAIAARSIFQWLKKQ
jgi:thioredoxin reductase (NADPH)